LIERLTKIFEPFFIHDSYACRVNKGTHAAVKRLQHFICSLAGTGKPAYYLQLDSDLLKISGLNPLSQNKRNAVYGFPVRKEAYYKQLLLKSGYPVLIVKETGNSYCWIKERVITQHYMVIP